MRIPPSLAKREWSLGFQGILDRPKWEFCATKNLLQTESPKVACLIFFGEKMDENRVFEHLILVDIEFNCLQGPPPM